MIISDVLGINNLKKLSAGIGKIGIRPKGIACVPANLAPLGCDTVEISRPKYDWEPLVKKLNDYITPERYLGGGGEADVYKINDKYVLRLKDGERTVAYDVFYPVEDIFEGKNFGQEVAKSMDGKASINKFVKGKQLYKANGQDEKIYMENLRKYANLPDKTLEDFVKDVAFINSKGYRIDESNPENFLYDEETGKIGIVDICKQHSSSLDLYGPYGHDWIISALANGHDYLDMYSKLDAEGREEMMNLITNLEARIIPMCKKYNIPIAKYEREKYTDFSMAELLSSKDKIDTTLEEGLGHQLVKLNHPEEIYLLEDMEINF